MSAILQFIGRVAGALIDIPTIFIVIYSFQKLIEETLQKDFSKPLISLSICDDYGLGLLEGEFGLGGIIGLVALAFFVSVGIAVIKYLLGYLLENKRYIAFLKTELIDLVFVYLFVLAGIGTLKLLCFTNVDAFGASSNGVELNVYEYAFASLQAIKKYSFNLLGVNSVLAIAGLFLMKISVANNLFGGIALPVFSGLSFLLRPAISTSLIAGTLAYMFYTLQIFAYEFFTYGGIKYLLPLGIIMRAFSPLKKVGAILIGFSLGASIVLSVVWGVAYASIQPIIGNNLEVVVKGETTTGFEVEMDLRTGREFLEVRFISDLADKLEQEAEEVKNKVECYVDAPTGSYICTGEETYEFIQIKERFAEENERNISNLVKSVFRWVFFSLGAFAIILIILPIITTLLMIGGIRFFSAFFGLELDISNLTKVV